MAELVSESCVYSIQGIGLEVRIRTLCLTIGLGVETRREAHGGAQSLAEPLQTRDMNWGSWADTLSRVTPWS